MVSIPEHELAALRAMSEYDQMLEIDRLCRQYGTDEATVRAALSNPSNGSSPSPQWDTSHKDVPQLQTEQGPSIPTMVNKGQFRFEYDPSREAQERREQVQQAILCAACDVALGIPDIRPIKVTCPACLFEATYTQ